MTNQEKEICIKIKKIIDNNISEFSEKSIFDILDIPIQNMKINSITFIKIIVEIEKEFDFEFDDEYLSYNKMGNLRNMVSIIYNYIEC